MRAILCAPGLSNPVLAADIAVTDVAFRSLDREAAMYVQASRLKIVAVVQYSLLTPGHQSESFGGSTLTEWG